MRKYLLICLFLGMILQTACEKQRNETSNRLWYLQPAEGWAAATPIGNGRLGAMIYGGIEKETVALTELTLWSGQPDNNQEKPFGKEKLDELRSFFFKGELSEGNQIASQHLSGNYNSFGTHLPAGDLIIDFTYSEGPVSNYKRELNLENAINTVMFNVEDTEYRREYFASNPGDAVIIKLSADKKDAFSCDLSFNMLRESEITVSDNGISFSGKADFPMHGPGGVNFEGKVIILESDGNTDRSESKLSVRNASHVVLAVDIRTDYKNEKFQQSIEETLGNLANKSYEQLKSVHVEDHSALFNRVDLYLGKSEYDHLPTDVRWKQLKEGTNNDTGLDALFFQYGRYLLIAASRENSPLPANLQGVWNDNLACNMSWTNDYHLDINTEQNYWIANVGNLHECHVPLFKYIKDLSVAGAQTTEKVYGCRGWTAHTVANVWGYTAPSQSIMWGLFPTAGSWIASHLWTQYRYTLDKDFLEKEAYPLLKGNATFLLDYMTEDSKSGFLMTGPSISPENWFKFDGEGMVASMMPSCDRQLVFETFSACIEAAGILGTDTDFVDSLQVALGKLPPIQLGKNGAIREWYEDFEEAQPNHRHTSHLLGFYPFSQITLEKTPELADGVRKTIENRLAAEGWEDTEWSRANMICFYARLKDPQEAYKSTQLLLQTFTGENLMTISPKGIALAPYDIFIFDGNTAGAAGIAEMLIHHHEGYIEFIPTLPDAWKTGRFKGLCVPGGAETDLVWEDGNVVNAKIKATSDYTFRVKVPSGKENYSFKKNGSKIRLSPDEKNILQIILKKNDVFEIE